MPPAASSTVRSSNDVAVAVHDLGGRGPALLVSHATGFHGRCYLPLADALGERFHSVALDYRGHGDTPLPAAAADRVVDWNRYADDAQAVAEAVRERAGGPIAAFGHSMGGACLLMAAHRDPGLFDRLVLFEPIVFPPPEPDAAPSENRLATGARRRRRTFPSFQAAIDSYGARPPLNAFTPEALEAYVRYGFAPGEDGQVHLKCEPETEASTFEASALHPTWQLLPEIEVRVLVVAGRVEPMQPSSLAATIAERLPNGAFAQHDEYDHFGPMSHPQLVADVLSQFVAAGRD